MAKIEKDHYFVGHAHIDPAWCWDWQEGSCVTKGTIRSALDRIKEYPGFTFMFPTALVFHWIEEFDPTMFEEMKQRIEEGRLLLVGGTFVEPDENIPCGEGLARQFLYAQRYYKEKFGRTVTIGFNPDTFGRNAMMPQILKKSGIKNYTFMRPEPWEFDGKQLTSNLFKWRSPDGSEILGFRSIGYGNEMFFYMQNVEELEEKIEFKESHSTPAIKESFFFYGVGNHGGGPTKKNIESIIGLIEKHPDKKLKFSNFQDLFDAVEQKNYDLPTHLGELQSNEKGCYAAVSEIKQNVRACEESLIAAEKYAIMANALYGKKMPTPKEFEAIWKKMMFLHFHDVVCGTCTRWVYKKLARIAGAVHDFADIVENNALQTLSWAIDTSDSSKGTPVVVFNPHSFEVEQLITVNEQFDCVTDSDGNAIPSKRVWSPKRHNLPRGDDLVFVAKVPALGYATYYMSNEKKELPESKLIAEDYLLENDLVRVEFDFWSGQIKSFFDKKKNKELLVGNGAVPVIMNDTDGNTWGQNVIRFNKPIGQFVDPKFTLLEKGPVRARLRVETFYGKSKLTQVFTLTENSAKLDVDVAVDWHEKFKTFKIAFPVNTDDAKPIYDVPFGVAQREADSVECPAQKWVAMKGKDEGFAILNNGKYSYSAEGTTMYLTVLRSPIYCESGLNREDPEAEISDQGLQEFRYALLPFDGNWGEVNRQAIILNKGLTNVIENNHNGTLPESMSAICCSNNNVIVSAIKRSEDNNGLVVRLTETVGEDTAVTLSGPALRKELDVTLTKWSTDTFLLEDSSDSWRKVMLTEFEIED